MTRVPKPKLPLGAVLVLLFAVLAALSVLAAGVLAAGGR